MSAGVTSTLVLSFCIGSCMCIMGCGESPIERAERLQRDAERERRAAECERDKERKLRNQAERERSVAVCERDNERVLHNQVKLEREQLKRELEQLKRERAERERALREQAERERLAAEPKRAERLREHLSMQDSRIWRSWYILNAVIGNRKKNVDKLRNENKLFKRNPDEDGNVKRLVADLNSVVSMRDRFVEELEKSYLLSCDSTPDKENSAKLLESRERLLRLARKIETLF